MSYFVSSLLLLLALYLRALTAHIIVYVLRVCVCVCSSL